MDRLLRDAMESVLLHGDVVEDESEDESED